MRDGDPDEIDRPDGPRLSPAVLAARWGRSPESSIDGLPGTGLSAALWRGDGPDEMTGFADPRTHVVCLIRAAARVELRLGGRRAFDGRVRAGSCQIVVAGETPWARLSSPWEMLHLYMPHAALTAMLDRMDGTGGIGSPGGLHLIDPLYTPDPVLDRLGQDILSCMAPDGAVGPFDRLYADTVAQTLGVQLLRRHSSVALPAPRSRGGLAPWQIRRITDYLMAHIAEDVALETLCGLVGLSGTHLCTAFRQSTGLPPHQWQIQRRIDRAKDLLRDPALSITEVSLRVGYANSGHFATLFRKVTGTTPRNYRRHAAG
jgi:AraC family transcriptional regulator